MSELRLGKYFCVLAFCFTSSNLQAVAPQTPFDQGQGAGRTIHPLFSSHPVYVNPGEYARSAVASNLDTRGLALGAARLNLILPTGEEVVLSRHYLEKRGKGDIGWFGQVEYEPDSEAVLTLKKGLVVGRIRIGAELYELTSSRTKRLTVEQLDPGLFPELDDDSVAPEENTGGQTLLYAPASSSDGTTTIDLLSVYSNDALADAGSTAQMEATIQAAVDAANSAFINSDMTLRYRLVHMAHVDYNTAGTTGDDLGWVTNDDTVAALRDQYGADMVSLLVDTPTSCGTGWVQRNPGPGFEAYAFQATDIDCAVGNLTLGHEHGHNLGMEHNPGNSSVGSTPSSASYTWSFAHYINGSFRTMMSYSDPCTSGCPRAQQVSNPNVSFNGYPTGIAGERDNARTGELTGPIAAAFRDTVVPLDGSIVFAALGDYGTGDAAEADVAAEVDSWTPDFIITAGDNRYGSNSFDTAVGRDYCGYLRDAGSGTYCNGNGGLVNAFFPSPGNHDYSDGGGIDEYLSYFTLPGSGVTSSQTSGSERYYDVIMGPVHIFTLDSDQARTSAADMSAQKAWLQAQLGASTTPWQVVIFHHAPYSSASHGSDPAMQWSFAAWGADAVLSGHDHTYERIIQNGIPYFVNGLGGRSPYSFGSPVAGSQVRYNADYGAMRITASNDQMQFEFVTRTGAVIDSYVVDTSGGGNPPAFGSVDVRIAAASDDVEQKLSDGTMYVDSTDLELGNDPAFNGDQTVGLRFQGINIPQGSTIDVAYLEFTVDEIGSDITDVTIAAQDTDNAAAFGSSAWDLTDRVETTATVPWSIPAWSNVGDITQSPDISAVVQEIVDRGGWTAGNNLVLIISGTGQRTAESYDGVPAGAPRLYVEYSEPAAPNNPPSAGFNTVCAVLACNFSDTSADSDGSIGSWLWDFGDGNSSNAQNPSHSYAAPGTYTVTLTVTDDDGADDSASQSVTVTALNEAPSAAFTSSITDLDANFTDSSTDNDGTIDSWAWDFGDGSSSTAQNPSHSYASAGSYTVSLTVTDDDGADDSTSQSVTVLGPQPPAAPTDLTAQVQRLGKGKNAEVSVRLSWTDNSNNEESFAIERCEESGKGKNKTCAYGALGTVGKDTTEYTDNPGSGTFQYRVRARNLSGDSAPSNEVKI